MGVSRATLREAIAALRTARMVRTTRGRGGGTVVTIRRPRPEKNPRTGARRRRAELMDSLVFRRVVEPGACLAAASDGRASDRRDLRDGTGGVARPSTRPSTGRPTRGCTWPSPPSTGSPQLIDAVTSVQADLHDMLIAIPVLPVNIEHSNAQHADIVEAILAGDRRRARRVMESHCDDTAALLRGLLVRLDQPAQDRTQRTRSRRDGDGR